MPEDLISDLAESSPVTICFLAVTGGSIAYILLRQVYQIVKFILKLLPDRATAQPTESTTSSAAARPRAVAAAPPVKQPGKSIKQLLKESKHANAAAQSHERIPKSDCYINTLKGHGSGVISVDISPDATHVLTCCSDEIVRIYNMKGDFSHPSPGLTRLPLKDPPVGAMFWGASDKVAVCAQGLGQVANFVAVSSSSRGPGGRVQQETLHEKIHGPKEAVAMCGAPTSLGLKPIMATMTPTKEVVLLTGRGEKVADVSPNGIQNHQVKLSSDGRFLAVTTWGSDVKLWEVLFNKDKTFKSCSKAMELKGHTSGVRSMAFNADTTRAVTSSKDGTLRTWRLDVRYHMQEDPKCLVNVKQEKGPYEHMAWCPNGVIVAAVGSCLHYINSSTGYVIERISDAHARPITAVVATPKPVKCGPLQECAVVTASLDSKARVWVVPSL